MLSNEYAKLYLKENEKIFEFEYKEDNNIFKTISIKRPIEQIGNIKLKENYYDLESPYGYGGYFFNTKNEKFLNKAFKKYKNYCKTQNIIAEFVRFHPFLNCINQQMDFCAYDRDIVVKELNEDIMISYPSKIRNIVRKCKKILKIKKSDNVDKFIEIYYQTMKKNNADEFYFFDKKYFDDLLKLKEVELYETIFEGEIIAMSFFIFSEYGYYHLSANTTSSYKLNANYLLLHKAFLEAKKRGIKYFILGGGTTSDENDTLLKFKKKFSKILKPFYIGGIIFNKEKYNEYIDLWQKQTKKDIKYFLKYRLEI